MNTTTISMLRKRRGWTQERLAEESGVTVRTIQRLEAGDDASLETLRLVADALEVNIQDLFETIGDDSKEQDIRRLDTERLVQIRRRSVESGFYWRLMRWGFLFLLLLGGALMGYLFHTFQPISLVKSTFGILWVTVLVIGWPSLKAIRNLWIEPRLDEKYPLTAGISVR